MSANNQKIKLKGNELAWIIRLAQEHLTTDFVRSMPPILRGFLYELMGRFHEANFYAGDSNTTWVLIKKEEES